ncbi:hypothetical protein KP509_02G040400 [Ceratopteris richardii]|uniref:Uncharacterized protein n=1 Tax=Ceratopteris richardii TaxID=49495 RepID=A0A8T2VC63_CERRI|nr:hypothetical protein KP509_02G040400 [Ceratopteris richardii]
MELRHRSEGVKYVSDSEEDEAPMASDTEGSDQSVLVMDQRRRKVKAGSTLGLSSGTGVNSLLRYVQPNVNNTTSLCCPVPDIHLTIIDDSDEDFVEVKASKQRHAVFTNRKSDEMKRNGHCRSARKSYKELTSSDEESNEDSKENSLPDLSTFAHTKDLEEKSSQKVILTGTRRLAKRASSINPAEDTTCVQPEDPLVFSDTEEAERPRRSNMVFSSQQRSSATKERFCSKEELKASSANFESVREPKPLGLHVDAYGICTSDGVTACGVVKRVGQVERILAVRNRGTDAAEYTVKECGRSYRRVALVKESALKSKCPQLLRNFIKRMEELGRLDGNPEEREEAPAFSPVYLHIERVVAEEVRKGGRKCYLVKWQGLPYTEATWEFTGDLPFSEDLIAITRFDQLQSRTPSTAPPSSDSKLLFKDGRALRDYQEKGLAWIYHNFQNRVNCILADEMGLGKTMQSVSMLHKLCMTRKLKGPFLVIAPVSTLGHWQREVESLTDMNCVVFSGSAEDRNIIKEYEFYYPKSQRVKFNVLLTSFEILMKEQGFLSKHEWQYVIVDEAHRLKSTSSKTSSSLKQLSIKRGGLLLLTGTPIQNNTKEIFSLLNILDPQKFSSEEEFLQKYGDLKKAEQVKDLQDTVLRPRLLRRLKEDVEKSIPLKEETIIWVELTKEQRYYYKAILENRISDLLKGSRSNNIPNLRNVAMELRKLCNHPFLCNGLQDDINSKLKLQDLDKSSQSLCTSSGKMMLLDKLLPMLRDKGHRVLVFSQFAIMLDLLEDYILSKNYTYERIDGSIRGADRQAAIDRYSAKDSDTFLFLLSTRAGGLGITLTAADTCIIFDSDWNPQNDLQAMARCHRIGQNKDVRIYRLITKDTYEQHLFECSSRKYGLDEAILGSMHAAITDNDHNANIENLLKKGAYSILREDGEAEAAAFHSQNIEQILQSRTEKRLVGGRGQNTFSVATFISNPDADSAVGPESAPDGDPRQFWQELLPEACNTALNDDKQPVLPTFGPRKRLTVNYREGHGNSEQESSDEEHESSKSRRRVKRKSSSQEPEEGGIKQWSEKELKQLENSLMMLGANRTDDIMKEAGLEQHDIREVKGLCDVMIQFCQYFQAKNALITNDTTNSEPPGKALKSTDYRDQGHRWDSSTFVNVTSEEAKSRDLSLQQNESHMDSSGDKNGKGKPTNVMNMALVEDDTHLQKYMKDLESAVDKKLEFPSTIVHPVLGKVNFPTIPPYAMKALQSQAFTRRLEKKATRYLQVLQEREVLAKAVSEGTIPPRCVRSSKKLPAWWSEAENVDLLLGAHRHGHYNFCRIRDDKSLCFSSKPDSSKLHLQRKQDVVCQDVASHPPSAELPAESILHPDQEVWPQDSVLATRLRQLIQGLQTQANILRSSEMYNAKVNGITDSICPNESARTPDLIFKDAPKLATSNTCLGQGKTASSKQRKVEHSGLHPIGEMSTLEDFKENCKYMASKSSHLAQGKSGASKTQRVALDGLNPITLSPSKTINEQKSVSAFCSLAVVKSKAPSRKSLVGNENPHLETNFEVAKIGSGYAHEGILGVDANVSNAVHEKGQVATSAKASSMNMDDAFQRKKSLKGNERRGDLVLPNSEYNGFACPGNDKMLFDLRNEIDTISLQENRVKGGLLPAGAVVDRGLVQSSEREPLQELNTAKRKPSIGGHLSNKKHKQAGKQQTLLGFLTTKSTKNIHS